MKGVCKMDYILSEAHIKLLKVLVTIYIVIITLLTLLMSFLFISLDGYNHPVLLIYYILATTSYINAYRFYRMIHYHNGSINSLQLKIWAMLFVRGIFVTCLYWSFYAKNIQGIIFFLLTYLATFFCNYFLIKAQKSKK